MLLSDNSDLVTRHIPAWQTTPMHIDLIHLKGGRVLALAANSMSLYKDESSLNDPLSNGLISSTDWPEAQQLKTINSQTGGLVQSFKAGVIHLAEEKTILITPIAIQLFTSPKDALTNHNAIAHITLE